MKTGSFILDCDWLLGRCYFIFLLFLDGHVFVFCVRTIHISSSLSILKPTHFEAIPGGVLPYIRYTGTCHPSGYGFSDRPLIKGSQIQRFSKIFYKQGLKIKHFDEKMSRL